MRGDFRDVSKGSRRRYLREQPVNYVKLDRVPTTDDWSPIVNALKRGDYFWTSGEVLIPSYASPARGNRRTVTAGRGMDLPAGFVEVVWGTAPEDGSADHRRHRPAAFRQA